MGSVLKLGLLGLRLTPFLVVFLVSELGPMLRLGFLDFYHRPFFFFFFNNNRRPNVCCEPGPQYQGDLIVEDGDPHKSSAGLPAFCLVEVAQPL